jgi:hypothetical protein
MPGAGAAGAVVGGTDPVFAAGEAGGGGEGEHAASPQSIIAIMQLAGLPGRINMLAPYFNK